MNDDRTIPRSEALRIMVGVVRSVGVDYADELLANQDMTILFSEAGFDVLREATEIVREHPDEEQCVVCGEWKDALDFEDGLRCCSCVEDDESR